MRNLLLKSLVVIGSLGAYATGFALESVNIFDSGNNYRMMHDGNDGYMGREEARDGYHHRHHHKHHRHHHHKKHHHHHHNGKMTDGKMNDGKMNDGKMMDDKAPAKNSKTSMKKSKMNDQMSGDKSQSQGHDH